jgi:biofilm PGA synthesis lipoprotein PgaB
MFKLLSHGLVLLALLNATLALANPTTISYDVLCYHDIKDEVDGNLEKETTLLSTKHLASHLNWLSEHGYHPISVDDILAAQQGVKPLPTKPVLLTFDDGYQSFYTHVYPLLKLFNYPAVVALVGSWLDAAPNAMVDYGDEPMPRSMFLSTAQIKEMAQSGHIEFASHSYNLHRGIPMNPYGNTAPAAITHQYDANNKRYESSTAYIARITDDLKRNSDYIEQITGKRPRIMTWPYGRYNQTTLDIAKKLGMPITFSLDDNTERPNSVQDLGKINRALIDANPNEQVLINILKNKVEYDRQRVVHIDLDYVYDKDEVQMWKNLDVLVERIKSLAPTTVYLQAFADPDGDGVADALYFQNRHLPVRADIFSRVARQLNTRSGVNVYAWMPVLSYDLPNKNLQTKLSVSAVNPSKHTGTYRRLSPFSSEAKALIKEIYEDLAKHALFEGLIFHDDATLSDEEDNSQYALDVYEKQWQLPRSISAIQADSAKKAQWATLKSRWITSFTIELANAVKHYQPNLKTARNLYANAMLNPYSEAWLAQNYTDFLANYDYTAVMAMPNMEKVSNPNQWLTSLVKHAKQTPNGIKKTIFELQSFDWISKQPIQDAVLTEQFALLLRNDAQHIGYYTDDFIQNQPNVENIRPFMSAREFPYLPK